MRPAMRPASRRTGFDPMESGSVYWRGVAERGKRGVKGWFRMLTRTATRWTALAAAVFTLLVAPAAGHATDAVTLTSGLIIEGNITVENDRVIKMRVEGRTVQFPQAAIKSIEYGPESTAPSQVQEREESTKADLEQAQEKVKAIKVKRRRRKKKKDKPEEEEVVILQQGVMADGTLIVPLQGTPEEEKWIAELRTGKNKMGACRELAKLESVFAVPDLINALDGAVYVRREANKALIQITHQDHGFKFDHRNRSVRVESIKRWRKWYKKASGKRVPWKRL